MHVSVGFIKKITVAMKSTKNIFCLVLPQKPPIMIDIVESTLIFKNTIAFDIDNRSYKCWIKQHL